MGSWEQHVAQEFEFGILTVENPYHNGWRENFDFRGDDMSLSIVTFRFRSNERLRS
jgi:hypothetical protein